MKTPEITFKEFRDLAIKRHRSVDDLVGLFRGKIDEPREFFERVMSCKYRHEDRSSVVIPFRSAIDFYLQEKAYVKDLEEDQRKQAEKRKRGPVDEATRQRLAENLRKARLARTTKAEK